MKPKKILFVDDEKDVLDAIVRQLRKTYVVGTATSGRKALEKLESGDFMVVVSDLRMPGMDGITLLKEVRRLYPEITRIILSGDADLAAAIDAVNSGQVFRFLTKPCSNNGLATTLALAVRQYQLVTGEKELLGNTLKGSINMLVELLSLTNPRAFSRGRRIRPIVAEIAEKMGLKPLWQVEVAALVCQIGCVAIPEDILNKVSLAEPLDESEVKMYSDHPRIGAHLLRKIPRLEGVAEIIGNQLLPYDEADQSTNTTSKTLTAAHVLKAALDYDLYIDQGNSHEQAVSKLYGTHGRYNPDVLAHLQNLQARQPQDRRTVDLLFDELVPGMIAAEDILARNGAKIIAKNQEITWPALQGLHNFIEHIGVKEPIKVWNC